MKETGILMTTEMRELTLTKCKTNTRRVIILKEKDFVKYRSAQTPWPVCMSRRQWMKCPYGIKGDRLYIKEPHYLYGNWKRNGTTKTGRDKWLFNCYRHMGVAFKEPPELCTKKDQHGWFKRTPLFMYKWCARTWLEIENIRVERIQDISWEDAVKEGIFQHYDFYEDHKWPDEEMILDNFKELWNKINEARGHGWDQNDWVFAYDFKLIKSC